MPRSDNQKLVIYRWRNINCIYDIPSGTISVLAGNGQEDIGFERQTRAT